MPASGEEHGGCGASAPGRLIRGRGWMLRVGAFWRGPASQPEGAALWAGTANSVLFFFSPKLSPPPPPQGLVEADWFEPWKWGKWKGS